MSRQQQDEARARRMVTALDRRDPATVTWMAQGIARLTALANHPAGRALADSGPREPAAWTPTPDPAHTAPPNRSILRDLVVALVRKVIR
ncbi:hypothetical protein TSOC111612_01540 [Tsukamurella ocularis]|uniref:hypothetical protein n=1 Tax=Tsukamurella ocularis TaxID=1970234 RepID=UPI0039F05E82